MSKSIIRSQRWFSLRMPALVAGALFAGAFFAGLCAGGLVFSATCLAADTKRLDAGSETPATQPAVPPAAPVDPAIRALAIKLGDDDPAVRDDVTKKLSDLGKAAVPALREAAQGDDPEARTRALNLLHHIERRLPPPAPPPNGMGRSQSMRMSMNQGVRTIDVNDNGRKVHIVAHPDGQIEMSVTGIEDGKEATETYRAKDADELKKDNPEAFAIYDQWAGAHGAMVIKGGGLFGGGVQVQIMPGGPGGGALIQPVNPQDLQLRLEQQQKQIEELQRRLEAEIEERAHDRMRGQTGKDDAPSDAAKSDKSDQTPDKADKADKAPDKPNKADDKPAERPQTRPQ